MFKHKWVFYGAGIVENRKNGLTALLWCKITKFCLWVFKRCLQILKLQP